ncbi:MAG: NYN domain-containing protein [Candidatus Aminicenantes bacterium]|nr:NYN domain-containing protein [Candidatus Aminicenantes bacterium]
MSKSIIMIDGGFFKKKFEPKKKAPTNAKKVQEFIKNVHDKHAKDFDLLRVYYYDCPPSDETLTNPISLKKINLKSSKEYANGIKLLHELKRTDFFAVREGKLSVKGWKLRENVKPSTSGAFKESDYKYDIHQKGVDIKIGIDIAWISYQHIADRIIIVTGDSDFIPAIKLARRQGIQVVLLTLNHGVYSELKDNVDVLDSSDIACFIK